MPSSGVTRTGREGTTGVSAISRWNENKWLIRRLRTSDKHSETRRQHTPDAAAVYCLKGKLWHAHGDPKKAVECYVESLKLNPFMWDAFAALCETGKGLHLSVFTLRTDSHKVPTSEYLTSSRLHPRCRPS